VVQQTLKVTLIPAIGLLTPLAAFGLAGLATAGRDATTESISPNSFASSGDKNRSRSMASSITLMSRPVCLT